MEGNVLEKFAYENSSGRNMAFFLDETKKLEKFHQRFKQNSESWNRQLKTQRKTETKSGISLLGTKLHKLQKGTSKLGTL